MAHVERFATMAALAFDSARQRDTLREQARTDGLTGLLNHRACHERLGEEIERAAALDLPLSVVVLDLDHFKTVNDAYGHGEGDKVLVAAAEKLRSVVRDGDLVARLGGEEFALILPGVDSARAAEAAERARAAIGEIGVGGCRAACSGGVATYPEDAGDAARLLELADGALYWAKRSGRDQSRRYDSAARRAALGRRPARGDRGAAGARRIDRAGLPARAGARHGPRRRIRGARADARWPVPPARPMVQPGASRRSRRRARGRCDQGRAGRARTAPAHVPVAQRQPRRAAVAGGPRRAARRPLRAS